MGILSFFLLYFGSASVTPQHAHYWVVESQSQNSGYRIARLCPSLYLGFCAISPRPQMMPLVPLYPPPIFTRVPCPPREFAHAYSLCPPIASSPSVCCLVWRPPPSAPVVTRRPTVWSLRPSYWLPPDDMLPLVACPASWYLKVCPAWLVRLLVLDLGVCGGA